MKYFYSVNELSTRLIDIINVYILPFINLYSFVCTILSVIIFSNRKLKGELYQYMLMESIASLIYFILNSFIFIIRCGVYCSYGYSYYSKFYELYFYIYIGKSIEIFNLLIDLHLSFLKYRSFSFKQNTYDKIKKNGISLFFYFVFLIIISLVFNILAIILGRSVVQIGNLVFNTTSDNETRINIKHPLYIVTKSSISKNEMFNIMAQIVTTIQGPFLLMLIIIFNIIISYKLKCFLAKKSSKLK